MTITINEQDKKLVVTLVGDLDNMASSEAERSFAPIYDRSDCDVVFDCSGLNYISSSGLPLMLNVYKHTRSNGHRAVLLNLMKKSWKCLPLAASCNSSKQLRIDN